MIVQFGSDATTKERRHEGEDNQKSDKTGNGISRDTLNDWQRKDAAKTADEAEHREDASKDTAKQAKS